MNSDVNASNDIALLVIVDICKQTAHSQYEYYQYSGREGIIFLSDLVEIEIY